MTTAERIQLHGHSVLVRSSRDQRNPPTALRGTIDAQTSAGEERSHLRIVLEYPDMFTIPAHQGIIELTEAQEVELCASENAGVFSVTIDEELEPKLPEPERQRVS